MDETEINLDLAEEYLLGKMDEESRLDFEADVLPDEDLAEQLEVVRHELSEKYLDGELTGDRRRRFERHFLSSPYNREVFLSTQALLDAVKEMPVEPGEGFLSRLASLFTWKIAIRVFASLLLVAGAAFVFLLQNDYLGNDISHILVPPPILTPEIPTPGNDLRKDTNNNSENANEAPYRPDVNASNQSRNAQPAPTTHAPTFALIFLPQGGRGVGSKELVLKIKKTDKTVKLEFLGPEENPGQNFVKFSLNVEDVAGSEIWSGELSKKENKPTKKMQYQLDAGPFKSGTYIFRIMGIPETGAPENVQKTTFTVIRSEN